MDSEPVITQPPDLTRLHNSSSPTVPTKLPSSSDTTTTTTNANDTSTSQEPPSYLSRLQKDGFVVIPNLLPPHLLLASQASCKYLIQRTRPGGFWPHVRTVPKQYPPWPKYETPDQNLNIWGIQHLLHPHLTNLRDIFAEIYFSNEVLTVVKQLLADPTPSTSSSQPDATAAVPDSALVMELFNLLISPSHSRPFELEWHRDDIRPTATAAQELALLAAKAPRGRQLHAQYNLALTEDASLLVIPGSHRRARTHTERHAGQYDPLPSEINVHLNPGDAVFYDSNILHRGVYTGIDAERELGRMTLHGSVGLKGYGAERSRQVLQHAVGEWVETPGAEFANVQDEGKRARAEAMRMALIEMGKGREHVGYSLEG
ncbi:hypothetical protein LTR70_009018 [Exophiala xenobiotica]|uniref:Phytanoyl-CoA dioxygenase family protein n=1 Tax=Lithohypha guttulata TaxID=1690604 RepID=A0ABR0JYZ9_9EURO|nr:hypothetical protein LTR24_008764 [Lithohypha guttulata]KAK5311124.1 hypothetical protein LTR70_009018 [Exophiala xenobiotica]